MRVLQRCGNWNNGTRARSGLIVNTNNIPSNTNNNIGFRADSYNSQKIGPYGAISSALYKGILIHVDSISG